MTEEAYGKVNQEDEELVRDWLASVLSSSENKSVEIKDFSFKPLKGGNSSKSIVSL